MTVVSDAATPAVRDGVAGELDAIQVDLRPAPTAVATYAAPELRRHRMSGTSRRPAIRASASPVENAPNRTSPASEIFKMIGDRPNLDSAQCAVYR